MDQQPSLVSQVVPPQMWQFPMPGMPSQMQSSASVVVEQSAGSKGRRKRKELSSVAPVGGSELVSTSSGNDLTDTNGKRSKVSKSSSGNDNVKNEAEASSDGCNKQSDQNPQSSEPPKQDYIHVRARRGQATDSHSLAERARREKISERMTILQDLVPGCNKVIGKASVLDEIINYIQALQRQVEFLSMKLEAVNSRINSGIEVFTPKDFGAQAYESAPGLVYSSQPAREYDQGPATDWLHMQVGGAFERVT